MADERGAGTARDRMVSDVDRMCRGDSDPPVAELSDRAAVLVACGLTEPRITEVVLARLHRGMAMPTIDGFHQIRIIEEQRHEIRRALARQVPSVLRMALRTRLADLDRRYLALRSGYARGAGVFAVRLKDIRADRRKGVHLDTDDRGRLFDALASTPTMAPVPLVPRTIAELGTVAAARGQREMGRVVLPARVRSVVDSLPAMPHIRAERRRIPEMYTALIMTVGGLYDRLLRAYVRGGRTVEEVRLQFDAERELVGLSADLCRLREAAATAGVSDGSDGFAMTTGLGAGLDGVWAEVVDRTVAFRELVESVEAKADAAAERAERVDGIARAHGVRPPSSSSHGPSSADLAEDHLASRAGDRMLSTEAMRRLRGQLDPDS